MSSAPIDDPPVEEHESHVEDRGMSSRHLHRLLTGIYLEVRQTRQYIEFVHAKLVEHELGRELEPAKRTEEKAKAKRAKAEEGKETEEERFLRARAAQGIGNGGMDLTPEEQRAFARGEAINMED